MHVLIGCGGRDWTDRHMIVQRLEAIERDITPVDFLVVLEGGGRGADRIIGRWAAKARVRGLGWLRFNAQWEEHHPDWCPGSWCSSRRYCIGAGHRRNQEMLDYAIQAQAQSVIAFKDGYNPDSGRGGTEDMVRRAAAANVHGKVISHVARPCPTR